MQYREDTRTQAQKDAEIKQWVKEHTHNYRQRQATDSVPPDDPSGSYGMPPSGGGYGSKWWWRLLVLILKGCVILAGAVITYCLIEYLKGMF